MADITAVSKALNLTPQRVHQLTREGLPKVARGEYELGPCMAWYIRYLQKVIETRGGPASTAASSDLQTERRRLVTAQREKVEMENAVRRGDLTECRKVAETWAKNIAIAKSLLRVIASKIGPQLTNISDAAVIVDRIQTEIDAVLTELAGADDGSGSDLSRRAPSVGAAAETDDQPVGGPIPKAE
jgi:phage terminase Nu1 subunit (DNA packaging protein)